MHIRGAGGVGGTLAACGANTGVICRVCSCSSQPHNNSSSGKGGGVLFVRWVWPNGDLAKQRGGQATPHVCQVVRPPIPLDANVRGDVKPFYLVPQLVREIQDLCPQVDVFEFAWGVVPCMVSPSLHPAQHPVYNQQRTGANE